ncbi:M16 family metallopeptidase [Sphingosinicella terrae]|uniref:M16 family metallopeptidase n=1 Tax=Sphingosinicella terrae TaxID=2172047 RepID=UPI000E0D0947|nr:pitrilysin family protein [Sphingosinicella terrae]
MHILGALIVAAIVWLIPSTASARADPPPPLSVPSLDYTHRTLANGARIYLIRDPSASTATVGIWYDVGQNDDPRGRSGFAHLFEHLMFKTTRNLPQGVSAFVTSIGGSTNASTLWDFTQYYATAPASQLEALIWMEGERLRNLVVDEAAFRSERDVVKEELRQRILAQPYGRILYTLIPAFNFGTHPYLRPIGGTMADLDAATLDDVRAFHEAYYRPDNAVFVISGNFDAAQVDAWVDQYLGSIARPSRPIPRDLTAETGSPAPRTVDAYAPNVPLPALVFSWRAPAADDPDAAGLALIDTLLARGAAGRLRRRLIDELQLASNISSINLPARDGYAYALVVTLAQGREVDEAQAALAAEIATLRDGLVGDDELAAAKNAMLGDALARRETARGRGFELGGGVTVGGSPDHEDRQLAAIRALDPAGVQRIARRLLDDGRRIVIRYQDESLRPAGYAGDAPPDSAQLGTIVPAATRPPVTLASDAERRPPPSPGAALPRVVPTLSDRRLDNGLRIVAARSTEVPLVTLTLAIGGGDSADPAGKAGLADLLAAVAQRGAGGRSAAELASEVAALGGSLSASAEADATLITVNVPAAFAEAAGRLLADIARRPDLPAAELDRVRRQQTDALAVAVRQPTQAALRVLWRAAFAGTAYAGLPTSESLGDVSRDDLVAAHRTMWGPRNATLIVTGALTADEALRLAERLFGDWTADAAEAAPPPAPAPAAAPRILAVDIPGAGQTAVLSALPTVGRASPDWPALQVANARLGGGQQGLLYQEIRTRRGLSYGAGSQIESRRHQSVLLTATQTRNEAAAEVVGLVLDQLGRMAEAPVSPEVAAERSDFLVNALASQTERTAGLAAYVASLVTTGAPLATARVELLGERDLAPARMAAAARSFDPARATIVVAGDSRQWIEALRQRFPEVERVDADGAPAGQAPISTGSSLNAPHSAQDPS